MLVAREDLALEAAFWAQLPGNFTLRPRKSPITSRNLAAMAPFHNFPRVAPTVITGAKSLALLDHQRPLALPFFAARERSRAIRMAAAAKIPATR